MSLALTRTAAFVYDPLDANGDPRGAVMAEAQLLGTEYETLLFAATRAAGTVVFTTKAEADTSLAYAAQTLSWIVNDPTPALNGIYKKLGISGSGSWARAGDLPYQVIGLTTTGTANAIVGTSGLPVPQADRAAIIIFSPVATSTTQTPTLAINGDAPLAIKDNAGADLAVGTLVGGAVTQVVKVGSQYRLLLPADFAALAAQAAASAATAVQAAADAAASAGSVLPSRYATRAAFAAAVIAAAVSSIETSGYTTAGDGGGGMHVKLGAAPGTVKRWHTQSADGAWWELRAFPVRPKQLGALGDDAADDTLPVQEWVDYAAAYKVPAVASEGTYVIPSATINVPSGVDVEGVRDFSVFKRTTESPLPLFLATGTTGVSISKLLLQNVSGATSASSNTISVSSKTFVTQAGKTFATGNSVFLVSAASPTNYMIGTVTSYTGTSMVINVTAAIGSGTFTSWEIYRNSGENVAVRSIGAVNTRMKEIKVSGSWYVGLEHQNCNAGCVEDCEIGNKCINRPIYVYGTSGTTDDISVRNNQINGGGYTQYGINFNGSGGTINNCDMTGNRIEGCGFQGGEIGGSCTNCSASGNRIEDLASGAVGVLVQLANTVAPVGTIVANNNIKNCPTGIWVINCGANVITGNNISGGTHSIRLIRSGTGSCLGNVVTSNICRSYTVGGISFESDAASLCGQSVFGGNFLGGLGSGQYGFSTGANTDRIAFFSMVSIANASNTASGTNQGSSGDSVLA